MSGKIDSAFEAMGDFVFSYGIAEAITALERMAEVEMVDSVTLGNCTKEMYWREVYQCLYKAGNAYINAARMGVIKDDRVTK